VSASSSPELFEPRCSVFLSGSDRSLLNWVAFALVSSHRGGFLWGHVKLEGEILEESDLLKSTVLPPERLLVVSPRELVGEDLVANVAVGGLVRSEREDGAVRNFVDFLRLPTQTQEMISRLPAGDPRPVLVLSGAHRLASLYPMGAVAPTIRAVVEAGGSMLVVWADAPVSGRLAFDRILNLRGGDPLNWKDAVLTVERGWNEGPLRTGAEIRLGDLSLVAEVLGKAR